MDFLSRNWFDLLLLVSALIAFASALLYARRQRNWIVGLGIAPSFLWLAIHYFLRSLDIPRYEQDFELQQQIVRPALVYLFLFSAVFFANGRVNQLICRMLAWRRRE